MNRTDLDVAKVQTVEADQPLERQVEDSTARQDLQKEPRAEETATKRSQEPPAEKTAAAPKEFQEQSTQGVAAAPKELQEQLQAAAKAPSFRAEHWPRVPPPRPPPEPKKPSPGVVPLHVRLRRRWWITSEAFVEMLGKMRNQSVKGQMYMEGLWSLIQDPPKGQKPFTGGDHLTFDDFAAALLYDTQDALQPKPGLLAQDTQSLAKILQRLEGFVTSETHTLDPEHDWSLKPEVFGKACWDAAAAAQVAFPGKVRASNKYPMGGFSGQRHLLFVGLPLALYCSDCPHLYQVLQRMRGLASLDEGAPTAETLRQKLDHDGRPYSVLVYALMAAWQALFVVRHCGISLEPLAPKGGALIFRGLWVPEEVDEHWAEHTWSFNSFSRSVEGVLSVLGFYGNATGSAAEALAMKDAHILILVARFQSEAGGGRWALPVQLFGGGENAFPASIEQEVLVPPFCKYHFLPQLQVCSTDDLAERQKRIQLLEQRWSLSLEQEAPRLLELLQENALVHQKGFLLLKDRVRVTIRFIQEIEPVYHLRELLRAPSTSCPSSQRYRLLNFPRPRGDREVLKARLMSR